MFTSRDLLDRLAAQGYGARVVPVEHVAEVEAEFRERHAQGEFSELFYQDRVSRLALGVPEALPDARSLVITAVPRPLSRAAFAWHGQSVMLPLPPTYVGYDRTRVAIEAMLRGILSARGYRAVSAAGFPLKLLAVRSGLLQYGRNNITYSPTTGSFHELVAVFTDLPGADDPWQEAQMMAACAKCRACVRRCPTGALAMDRFLLHAERCLTFHNEARGDVPFPAWIDPAWHTALVGCMACQTACPQNRAYLNQYEVEEAFSEAETALLLTGAPAADLPPETLARLAQLDLLDYYGALPRNLGVFISRLKD